MAAPASDLHPEPWGEDPRLVALLGEQGATGFRALFDSFPEAVGLLWALRDADGLITDFAFGYGNPSMLRRFRLPAATRDRYTLLEALPQMRDSRAFDAYVQACEAGQPWVEEITYDTPFGDGYMLGTFVHRAAKLGDGLIVFLTDVTDQRRIEAELRNYADVVAHDLREPLSGIAVLVTLLEQRPAEPPSADVLRLLRESTERARQLIDGVLVYVRVGELRKERVALDRLVAEVAEDLRPGLETTGATLVVDELPEVDGDPRQLRRVLQNLRECAEVPQRGAAADRAVGAARHPRMGRDGARQRPRSQPQGREPAIRHVRARPQRRRRHGDRPRRMPPSGGGPRRAHLGRGRRGRWECIWLHPAALTGPST